jgi:hypothetical protein
MENKQSIETSNPFIKEQKEAELRASNYSHLKLAEEAEQRHDDLTDNYHQFVIALQTKFHRVLTAKERECAYEYCQKAMEACDYDN